MNNKQYPAWFSHPRRRFLIGLLATASLFGIGRWLIRTPDNTVTMDRQRMRMVLDQLCDQFIPANDVNPGAVALGVPDTLLQQYQRRTSFNWLQTLCQRLEQDGFITGSSLQRKDLVKRYLRDEKRFAVLLHRCVQIYYSQPEAWASLNYQKPQPHGYLNYNQCHR